MAKSTSSPQPPAPLLRSPLYPLQVEINARMTPFAGWEMPVQFSSIRLEHEAVRQGAGLFDISHMGKFQITGAGLMAQLQYLVPSDLGRLQPGEAQYTVLLNSEGGIIDDLIFYYQGIDADGAERVMAIVNAATTDTDRAWITQHLDLNTLEFEDLSRQQALLAVQGPEAIAKLQKVVDDEISAVGRFGHLQSTVFGKPAFLARTGYTGEDGFEVMVAPDVAQDVWRSLLSLDVVPCGLGARDTLRLEAAMALYGQDIDTTTTPLEAGLSWLVHLDQKGEFIGRSVLEHQKQAGVTRRLVGLQMQGRNIARHGYPVIYKGDRVGEVTSGTLSTTLGYPIAFAYVPIALSKFGQELAIEIRGKTYAATVVKRPFYKRS